MIGAEVAHLAILGSAGIPARYGGFETLTEQLALHHAARGRTERLSIYCSAPAHRDRPDRFREATLHYSRFRANGASSILYDASTLRDALRRGVDAALLLGVSGAFALPSLARQGLKVVTHVDGLEWRRRKWSPPARAFLRWSEAQAVRHSRAIIADSAAIAEHLRATYGVSAEVIAYGGDQAAIPAAAAPVAPPDGLAPGYLLALCRIEPENNVEMILRACAATDQHLVFVGNWDNSRYGRNLRRRFGSHPGLDLLDPVYAAGPLHALRAHARAYVHGHSAGGTNPALVEMMHAGLPVLAFDCVFNRQTTENQAIYFHDAGSLGTAVSLIRGGAGTRAGAEAGAAAGADHGPTLRAIAQRRFTWGSVATAYFDLLNRVAAT